MPRGSRAKKGVPRNADYQFRGTLRGIGLPLSLPALNRQAEKIVRRNDSFKRIIHPETRSDVIRLCFASELRYTIKISAPVAGIRLSRRCDPDNAEIYIFIFNPTFLRDFARTRRRKRRLSARDP